jgi:hypothetical protein
LCLAKSANLVFFFFFCRACANRQLLLGHEDLAGLDEEGAKQALLQMGEDRHAEKREGLATLNNKVRQRSRGGLALCHVLLAVVCSSFLEHYFTEHDRYFCVMF